MIISLRDRNPVTIVAKEWPEIASVRHWNGEDECQANRVTVIRVREHADGRRLVYGKHVAGPGGMCIGERERYSGYLLVPVQRSAMRERSDGLMSSGYPDDDATVRAIHDVAKELSVSQWASDTQAEDLAMECIGELPAEAI